MADGRAATCTASHSPLGGRVCTQLSGTDAGTASHRSRHVVAANAARLPGVVGQAGIEQLGRNVTRLDALGQPLVHKVHHLLAAGGTEAARCTLNTCADARQPRWRTESQSCRAARAASRKQQPGMWGTAAARRHRLKPQPAHNHSGALPPPQTQPACFSSLVHHIPDAVAGQHQERVVARQPLRQHIRLGGDDLVLGLQLQLIASSGQSKTISGSAAHPATPRRTDVQDPARDQRAAWRRQAAVTQAAVRRSAPHCSSCTAGRRWLATG